MKRSMKFISGIFLTIMLLASCQEDYKTGAITIRMKDAPGVYEEVNVEIKLVQIHHGDSPFTNSEKGWINMDTKGGVYNLHDLQNGVTAPLVIDEELPIGKINQMRLVLGDHNSVLIEDSVWPLELASEDRNRLTINLNTTLRSNDKVEIVFDFDGEKSVVLEENGTYKLKPVLHLESIVVL